MELVSIATDDPSAWLQVAQDEQVTLPLLSDAGAKVSGEYGVMAWKMGDEPGHTFVLVDQTGIVRWVGDYGAMEHGGLMNVEPAEVVKQVTNHLADIEEGV